MHRTGPREMRLRTGYAELYPELPVDTWLPVWPWVETVQARSQHGRRAGESIRTFDSRHFEFRGGSPPRRPGEHQLHTRAEDR
jgi:hypothetical protein